MQVFQHASFSKDHCNMFQKMIAKCDSGLEEASRASRGDASSFKHREWMHQDASRGDPSTLDASTRVLF